MDGYRGWQAHMPGKFGGWGLVTYIVVGFSLTVCHRSEVTVNGWAFAFLEHFRCDVCPQEGVFCQLRRS